jgi:hypothetical protein
MTIGKSAACLSRCHVQNRPKTMCRQKLRNEVPAAWHPLYLAFPIGRTKSTLNYAISRFSAHEQILSLCTDSGQSPHLNAHAVCILQAGSMRSFACGTRAVACSSSGSSTGLSKQSGALITRDGKRDSGHSPFRGPPGDAHRARGSRYWLLFNGLAAALTVDTSTLARSIIRRFQLQPLRHLGAEADFKVTAVDPHPMPNVGELACDRDDRAQHT